MTQQNSLNTGSSTALDQSTSHEKEMSQMLRILHFRVPILNHFLKLIPVSNNNTSSNYNQKNENKPDWNDTSGKIAVNMLNRFPRGTEQTRYG